MNIQELRTNKQELISKYELIKNSFNFDTVATDGIISDLKRLDEPEAGNADEAPRYVKNILARLRELPLHDREVWLKVIMGEFEKDFSRAKWCEGYEQGKFEGEWIGQQLKDADKIRQELNKPVIPQFVADWIEVCKENLAIGLYIAMNPDFMKQWNKSDKLISWVRRSNNQDLFARAWLDGYEVEKEKRYVVKVKSIGDHNNYLKYNTNQKNWYFDSRFIYVNDVDTKIHHTRKELEEANFGWVFDCPGIEIEEVEG